MHGRDDLRLWPDQTCLLQQCQLYVGIASAFAEANSAPVDGDAAANDEIYGPHFLHAYLACHSLGHMAGGGFLGRDGQGCWIQQEERQCIRQPWHRHRDELALAQGTSSNWELRPVGNGLDGARGVPNRQRGKTVRRRLGSEE